MDFISVKRITLKNGREYKVLDWLEEHPELRTEENTEDMWSYRDPEEDTDDENEEDDW